MTPRHATEAARHGRKRMSLFTSARTPWRRARWARHVSSHDGGHHPYPWAFVVVAAFLLATTGTAWAYFAATSTTHTYAVAKADPLAAPTGVKATEVSTSSVDIDWSNPPEPSGTRYEVVRDPTTTATTVCTSATAGPCLDSGLAAGTTYTYVVVAYLGANWRSPMATVSYTTPAGST